jgi:hypothetical protein
MTRGEFRFDPPPVEISPELGWVLARAFGPAELEVEEPRGVAAVELAARLGLAPRIAARQPVARMTGELGPEAATELRRNRTLVAMQELRLHAALAAVDEAAADLRTPYAPLKGLALVLGGYSPAASRAAADVDLLVAEGKIAALQAELERRGFEPVGARYEHQEPALRHSGGGSIELHRVLPGVRLGGRVSSGIEILFEAGQLTPVLSAWGILDGRPRGDLRLPRREVLVAHALVHVLAQHGLAPQAYPGLVLVGDLLDLGFRDSPGRTTLAAIRPWIEESISEDEGEAALELASQLAHGRIVDPPNVRSLSRRLLDHFVAGATDPRYATALKARILERPLSDRSPAVARAAVVVHALVPSRERGGADGREPLGAYLKRLLARPFVLLGRLRSARAARRGEPTTPEE